MATSSLSLVKRQHVLGALKATGSRDPDVLFATKEALLDPVRPLRIIGLWGYVAGGLATALVLTAFLGIPLIVFSWWMRRRGKRNLETIEAAYAEYLDSLGAGRDPWREPRRVAGSGLVGSP